MRERDRIERCDVRDDGRSRRPGWRVPAPVARSSGRRMPTGRRQDAVMGGDHEFIALAQRDERVDGAAEAPRRRGHGVEHRLHVGRRLRDDLQDLGAGRLLLQRFAQLGEQPHVLDGDHGLRGEGLQELDLARREGAGLDLAQADAADRCALAQHRRGEARREAVLVATACALAYAIGSSASDVGDMDGLGRRGWRARHRLLGRAGGACRIADGRTPSWAATTNSSPSRRVIIASIAPQKRTAALATASSTGCTSVGDCEMTCRISALAVCCSSDSRNSVNSRTFWMAITAWSAKTFRISMCLSAEALDVPARQHHDADRVALALQGNADQRVRAAQLRQVATPVFGIVRGILDLHDRALQRRAADQAVVAGREGLAFHDVDIGAGDMRRRGPAIGAVLEQEDGGLVGAAQAGRRVGHGLQHGFDVGRRVRDDAQDLGRRGLLLERFGELAGAIVDPLLEAWRRIPRSAAAERLNWLASDSSSSPVLIDRRWPSSPLPMRSAPACRARIGTTMRRASSAPATAAISRPSTSSDRPRRPALITGCCASMVGTSTKTSHFRAGISAWAESTETPARFVASISLSLALGRGERRRHLRQALHVGAAQHQRDVGMRHQPALRADDIGVAVLADLDLRDDVPDQLEVDLGHGDAAAPAMGHRHGQVGLGFLAEVDRPEPHAVGHRLDEGRLLGEVGAAADHVHGQPRDLELLAALAVDLHQLGDGRHLAHAAGHSRSAAARPAGRPIAPAPPSRSGARSRARRIRCVARRPRPSRAGPRSRRGGSPGRRTTGRARN